MTLEPIIQRILDRGRAESEAVINAAKAEADSTLGRMREGGQENLSRKLNEAREAADKLRTQEIARAELEARKIFLASQRDVLEAVRVEALARLSSPKIKEEILRTLLDRSEADWKAGKVYSNTNDRELVRRIVGSRFGGTIDCAGGVIIESDDGASRIDLRFETLLQDIWEDSVKEIAEMLWPRH